MNAVSATSPASLPAGVVSISPLPAVASTVSLNVHLGLRNLSQLKSVLAAETNKSNALYHKWLTPAQFASLSGVRPQDVTVLATALKPAGLTVKQHGAQFVTVSGSAAAITQAFKAHLGIANYVGGGSSMVSTTPLVMPSVLKDYNAQTASLLLGSPSKADSTIHPNLDAPESDGRAEVGPNGPYYADNLRRAYSYPPLEEVDGSDTTIGIVMETAPNPTDTANYFRDMNLPTPSVSVVNIDGGAPFSVGESGEISLDVQQSAGTAPGASVVEYNMHSLDNADIVDAYGAAVDDDAADVVSGSFGICELAELPQFNGGFDESSYWQVLDDEFLQGNAQGQTFVFSSGDQGSECQTSQLVGVQFPASDPNVTAVGGTNLIINEDSSYSSENAFFDPDSQESNEDESPSVWGSGGGYSLLFPRPSYQTGFAVPRYGPPLGMGTPQAGGFWSPGLGAGVLNANYLGAGRSVPDLSLHMGGIGGFHDDEGNSAVASDSTDVVYLGGTETEEIGTSASAPDFAGTVALKVEAEDSRLGNVDPMLYAEAAQQQNRWTGYPVFRENIPGYSGFYATATTATGRPGFYDQVVGLGTLIGNDFVFDTRATDVAPVPPVDEGDTVTKH